MEHLDECALGSHAPVDPLEIVVLVISPCHVLIHPILGHGFDVSNVEPFLPEPENVTPATCQNDRIASALERPGDDERANGMRQSVPVKENEYRQTAPLQLYTGGELPQSLAQVGKSVMQGRDHL